MTEVYSLSMSDIAIWKAVQILIFYMMPFTSKIIMKKDIVDRFV